MGDLCANHESSPKRANEPPQVFVDEEKENIPPHSASVIQGSQFSMPENEGIHQAFSAFFSTLSSTSMAPPNPAEAVSSFSNTELTSPEMRRHSSSSTFLPQSRYQPRRPVENWKYTEITSSEGEITYLCSFCKLPYKYKKSLNKHFKDKHPEIDGPSEANNSLPSEANSTPIREIKPRFSLPLQRHKFSAEQSLNSQQPRSEIPETSREQSEPVDLTLAACQQTDDSKLISVENSFSRSSLMELLSNALNLLQHESIEEMTVESMSQTTLECFQLLAHHLELILSGPKDRKRSDGRRITCQFCTDFNGKWYSELKTHVCNHSAHKLFGCRSCSYRCKWKWDAMKHMRRCPKTADIATLKNEDMNPYIKFYVPPEGDLLNNYYADEIEACLNATKQEIQRLEDHSEPESPETLNETSNIQTDEPDGLALLNRRPLAPLNMGFESANPLQSIPVMPSGLPQDILTQSMLVESLRNLNRMASTNISASYNPLNGLPPLAHTNSLVPPISLMNFSGNGYRGYSPLPLIKQLSEHSRNGEILDVQQPIESASPLRKRQSETPSENAENKVPANSTVSTPIPIRKRPSHMSVPSPKHRHSIQNDENADPELKAESSDSPVSVDLSTRPALRPSLSVLKQAQSPRPKLIANRNSLTKERCKFRLPVDRSLLTGECNENSPSN
ncbi:unnamed protein product [Hymenolepis diminuta]|uniref:C2H2-type domain-containing protein n=1 Tax=Hymenolepis diminuta TaxID=6216 RepID=A0A564YZ58_HYMDI|nr:unnamed protein product [Hymenolepis diminuta]